MINCYGFEYTIQAFERIRKRFSVIVLADVQNQRIGLTDLLCQLILCTERDEFAVIDDADAVRKLGGFFHVMRGVEHGHALSKIEILYCVEDGPAGLRIYADSGFVHEKQTGLMKQSHADVDASLHASRVGFDLVFGFICQTDLLQHFIHTAVEGLAAQTLHLPPKDEILTRGQVFIEGQFLRHHTDDLFDCHRVFRDGMSADGRVACGGCV